MNKGYLLMFFMGFVACALLTLLFLLYSGQEIPLSMTSQTIQEIQAPSDWIDQKDILISKEYVLIKVSNASLSSYAPTGSMKPLFDAGANGIRIVPKSSEDIRVGDIVSFNKDSLMIVHRVVAIESDEEGKYFVTQGDNNEISDGRIRFSDIKFVTIGILW